MPAEFTGLLDTLRPFMGLGETAPEQKFDGVLLSAIEDAEEVVSRYCGRGGAGWLTAARVEYFSGRCSGTLLLTHTPVTAVSAVVEVTLATSAGVETTVPVDTATVTVDGYPIGAAMTASVGALQYRGAGSPTAAFLTGADVVTFPSFGDYPNFGDGRSNIKVSYTGGYATIAATPKTLKRAIMECAAELAAESPSFYAARERVSENKGRWKTLADPFVKGGVV